MRFIARSGLGGTFVLLLMGNVPCCPQQFRQDARIESSSSTITVTAASPRPMAQAARALAQRYGWIVDYEDPVYSKQESREVTDPAWRRTHPRERGAFDPSGGEFIAQIKSGPTATPNEYEVLNALVRQYNMTENPGFFKLSSGLNGRFTLEGRSRTESSRPKIFLEENFTPGTQQQLASSALEALVNQCSAASKPPVSLGAVAINVLSQSSVLGVEGKMLCRTGLERILASTNYALEYELNYDISSEMYYLNVVIASKLNASGSAGPLRTPLRNK